jgi:hypothetical protein
MSEQTTTAPAAAVRPDDYDDPYQLEDEIPPRPRRPVLTPLTGALGAVVLAGLGFIGGVEAQKHHGGSSGAATASSARAAFGQGAGGAGAGGGGAAPTIGTISSTHGGTLYVKDSSGTVVRVKTTAASKVSRTASSSAHGVHPGDTVVVQGTTAKNGTITATRVIATQAGASAFPGGFGGGGGAGGVFGGGTRQSGSGGQAGSG